MLKRLIIKSSSNFNLIINYFIFLSDYFKFKKLETRFEIRWKQRRPQITERNHELKIDKQYLYHTAWAARKLKEINPGQHIDISSYIYFSTIVSSFIPVKFYDYRPVKIKLDNFTSEKADLLKLEFDSNSIQSLSCMHTVEHIGLGRYGDPLNPYGDLRAISEIKRVLAYKGDLLFVVPIGREPKINFNAHRIYTFEQIISYFKDFTLVEFSFVPNDIRFCDFYIDADISLTKKVNYGCGCFWFKKFPKNNRHETGISNNSK